MRLALQLHDHDRNPCIFIGDPTLREARRRTLAAVDLPETEGITVRMDPDGPFPGFAEFVGNGRTVVHFSCSLPLHADRVVERFVHEACPGHHVQRTLIEAELVHRRGWVEWLSH